MNRPTMLLWRLLLDAGVQSLDSIKKDFAYVQSRVEKEGMSFLTITLPRLDDALLKGLSSGFVTPKDFEGFRPRFRGGTLPAFLQGLFTKIFHDDGSLRQDADPIAITDIRQIARLYKKVELPCSESRVKAGYERYLANDERVASWHETEGYQSTRDRNWRGHCGLLWSGLERFSDSLFCHRSAFGPGATAERLKPNERWDINEWPERAEGSFPLTHFALARVDSEDRDSIKILKSYEERPVRVVQVPKTLLTPRTISVEPSYMMLMQQSVAKPLMAYLESRWEFRGSIGFTDQSVNRKRAQKGSIDGGLATIDLKDASDMVPLGLVEDIFQGVAPTFLDYIKDSRSTSALLPDGTVRPLAKFASMGSAMCFPIEAMVFFTIISYAIVNHLGVRPSRGVLRKIAKDVVVYGDDIIVPTRWAIPVILELERHGLVVNRDKSFSTGLFRESCGGDYYKGVFVTPAYVRHMNTQGSSLSTETLVGAVSLANQFYLKGYWNAASYIRESVERQLGKRLPISAHPLGGLHWISFFRSDSLRYDRKLHCYRVKTFRIRARRRIDRPTTVSGNLLLAFSSRACDMDYLDSARTSTCQPSVGACAPETVGTRLPCDGNLEPQRDSLSLGNMVHDSGYAGIHGFHHVGDFSVLSGVTDCISPQVGDKDEQYVRSEQLFDIYRAWKSPSDFESYCKGLNKASANSDHSFGNSGSAFYATYGSEFNAGNPGNLVRVLRDEYLFRRPDEDFQNYGVSSNPQGDYGSRRPSSGRGSSVSNDRASQRHDERVRRTTVEYQTQPRFGRSLNESVVSHATSLKHGWTASPAGLAW